MILEFGPKSQLHTLFLIYLLYVIMDKFIIRLFLLFPKAIIEDVYPRKPNLVSKHALPVLWKRLESSSSASCGCGNIKETVKDLANLLYSFMGRSLFEQAQSKSHRLRQKLKEILDQ